MTESTYLAIIRIFMVIMPLELGIVALFARACIKTGQTNQPAFWFSLLCIGVLIPEMLRSIFILLGELPPHRKLLCLWIMELAPFGGFIHEIVRLPGILCGRRSSCW